MTVGRGGVHRLLLTASRLSRGRKFVLFRTLFGTGSTIALAGYLHTRDKISLCSNAADAFPEAIQCDDQTVSTGTVYRKERGFNRSLQLALRAAHLVSIFLPSILLSPALLLPYFGDRWWYLFGHACEVAGPAFIKLAQWASTRPDLFPDSLCTNLGRLRTGASLHPTGHTRAQLVAAFGCDPSEIFLFLDPVPVASGAVAQVHRGTLHDGRHVAVKVRHPGVGRLISLDLQLLRIAAAAVHEIPTFEYFGLPDFVDQFRSAMLAQTDFRIEAMNLLRFRHNFRSNSRIRFPEPLPRLSAEAVLVESWEEGIGMAEYLATCTDLRQRSEVAAAGLDVFMTMMTRDNFVHADLHAGNMMVRPAERGGTPTLVLLDVGLVAELAPADWRNFLSLFLCMCRGDGAVGGAMMVKHARMQHCQDVGKFQAELTELFRSLNGQSLQQMRVAAVVHAILSLARHHRVQLEGNFATLVVGCAVLEGLGRQLDPHVDFLTTALPHLLRTQVARTLGFV